MPYQNTYPGYRGATELRRVVQIKEERSLPTGSIMVRVVVECRALNLESWADPHKQHRVVSLSKTYQLPTALVKPRKRWVRPDMTEKLLTGTLSLNTNKINHGPNFCTRRN